MNLDNMPFEVQYKYLGYSLLKKRSLQGYSPARFIADWDLDISPDDLTSIERGDVNWLSDRIQNFGAARAKLRRTVFPILKFLNRPYMRENVNYWADGIMEIKVKQIDRLYGSGRGSFVAG